MFKKLLSVSIMVLGLTACAESENIKGNEYVMSDAPNGAEITLFFSDTDNFASGKVVNRYFGTYTINGNKLTFGPMGSTMMMGPEPLMQAEYQYLQDLPKTVSYEATSNGLTLHLSDNRQLKFKKTTPAK